MRTLIRTAIQTDIVAHAIKIDFVVGTLLNAINQGGRIIRGEQTSWLHVALNHLFPFCVASYSVAKNEFSKSGGA